MVEGFQSVNDVMKCTFLKNTLTSERGIEYRAAKTDGGDHLGVTVAAQ